METQLLLDQPDSPISGSPEPGPTNSPPPETTTVDGSSYISGGAAITPASLDVLKKKRGRPRKFDINGNLNPAYIASKKRSPPYTAVSLTPATAGTVAVGSGFMLTTEVGVKRGRGKHSVAVNWPHQQQQQQPVTSLGGMFVDTAGSDFTPHIIIVQTGEDVVAKIHSVSPKGPGPRGICVLAANGAISNVTIRQLGSSSGLVTYEGRFEILSLSGSYTMNEANGVTTKTGGLSISLAGPDGRVVGGNVAGWLTAANPIQVVVGTFVPYGYKVPSAPNQNYNRDSTTAAELPVRSALHGSEMGPSEGSSMPTRSYSEAENSIGNGHNVNVVSSHNNAPEWNNGSQLSTQQHRIYPDINVSVAGV